MVTTDRHASTMQNFLDDMHFWITDYLERMTDGPNANDIAKIASAAYWSCNRVMTDTSKGE